MKDTRLYMVETGFYFAVVNEEDNVVVYVTPSSFFDMRGYLLDDWPQVMLDFLSERGLVMVEDAKFEYETTMDAGSLEYSLREQGFQQSASFTAKAFGV